MENGDSLQRLGVCDPRDRFALRVISGVAARRHDDANRRARVPLGLDRVELAVDGRFEQIDQIALEPGEQHLGFGIAKAAVEFQQLRPLLRDHHAGEQQSSK